MSVAAFRLQDFIAQVKTKGLARVNRFEVIITPPPGINANYLEFNKISLLCEVSNFPPINLSVKPFKIFGPSYQRPITSEYGGDGISMTFHVDREMKVRKFFDDWIESVVDRNNFTVAYQSEYVTKILIRQLDEADNVNYEIELQEAFPRSITLMDLNQTAQNQTHRLNVIFAYRYWRRTDIPRNERQVQVVPRVSQQTRPVITPVAPRSTPKTLIVPTPPTNTSSSTLEALGGGDPGVSFENQTGMF
jgi:hypothetical protein